MFRDGHPFTLVRYGLLHRIPPQPIAGSSTPPELQDNEDEYEEQELFVPADIPSSESQYIPSQLTDWRKQQEDEWNRESQAARSTYEHSYHSTVPPIQEEEYSAAPNEHTHHHHAEDPDTTLTSGPPRRTSSLVASSSLRSSRGTVVKSYVLPSPRSTNLAQFQPQSSRLPAP